MRTLHFGLRVADLDRSLAFYTAVGYQVVGSVPETPLGHLIMLKLPGDEFVTIELVHNLVVVTAQCGFARPGPGAPRSSVVSDDYVITHLALRHPAGPRPSLSRLPF